MSSMILEVRNLCASVEGKEILKGVNLTIGTGEIHALMGPNGSGKSTLSNVLVGNPQYTVTQGEVFFNGKNLLSMSPENRSHEGIFMSFQQPVEIPGVSMNNFLRAALDAKRKVSEDYARKTPSGQHGCRIDKEECQRGIQRR